MDSPLFRPAALAAAACTVVQACVWMVLSLLALLAGFEVMGPTSLDLEDLRNLTPREKFNLAMIGCYFPRSAYSACCVEDGLLLRGPPMLRVSILYLIASFAWFFIGVVFLRDMQEALSLSYRTQVLQKKKTAKLALIWAAISCVISLIDFIVANMFGADYNKMSDAVACVGDYDLAVARVLMFVAARGYVLWHLNVLAAILLGFCAAKKIKMEEEPTLKNSEEPPLTGGRPRERNEKVCEPLF